jgi:hypothetical protein
MVLGQTLWIETAGGGAGIAGEMQVTAISGTSVTLLNVSVGAGGAPIWGETPGGNINGINLNYTTANPYTSGHLAVYLNGLRLRRTNDYIETGSQTFQILAAPLAGDSLSVDYM